MISQRLFLAAVFAFGAAAERFGCGTPSPDSEHIGMSKILAAQEARRSQTVAGGYLTDKMLSDQLAVLNADFAPHDIAFNLLGTDRIINAGWAVDNNEIAMKTALRKGGYGDLNVYFQVRLMKNFLGYAQLPGPITPGSFAFIRDGVSLNAQTVPGGSQATFNLGKTATHEVGHWLGLYHTFNGNSCTGPGDLVDDTPVQAGYSTGCPIGRDSCPNHPGLDPIHNYMDYTDDACYEEFTPGQEARMYSFWNAYRA